MFGIYELLKVVNYFQILQIFLHFELFPRNLVSLCLHIDMDQRTTKVYNGAYSNNSQIPGNKILYINDNVCDILQSTL